MAWADSQGGTNEENFIILGLTALSGETMLTHELLAVGSKVSAIRNVSLRNGVLWFPQISGAAFLIVWKHSFQKQ